MENFREKHPGLSEEQLQIKYRIWQREKEREKFLNEAKEKKKIKDPFSETDENDEMGAYDGSLDVDSNNGGVISDGAILGAEVSFIYPQYSNGIIKTTFTDLQGRFLIPRSFGSGTVVVKGGTDTVLNMPYKGQFNMDAPFLHSYRAITPLTHIANHIWNGTPTRFPREAMNAVVDYIFHFMGIPHSDLNIDRVFNDDHIRLTLDDVQGAKEIQAINTLIEIHAELISGLKANYEYELEPLKVQTYQEIGNALLTRVNGQESSNYFENIFKFHISGQDPVYDKCCIELLERARFDIKESLKKESHDATSQMQSVNLIVKDEWTNKALLMTQESKMTPKKLWNNIENKDYSNALDKINLSESYL